MQHIVEVEKQEQAAKKSSPNTSINGGQQQKDVDDNNDQEQPTNNSVDPPEQSNKEDDLKAEVEKIADEIGEEFDDEATVDDIEKRKSFADMKLAEVASGGSNFNFDSSKNGSNDECNASQDNKNGLSDSASQGECNGHNNKETVKTTAEDEEDVDGLQMEASAVGDQSMQANPEGEEDEEEEEKPRLDPVHHICPDLEVKIADLGNACWVVSL